jgi:hypothetical protein
MRHVLLESALRDSQLSHASWIGQMAGPSWRWLASLRTLNLGNSPTLGLPMLELLSVAVDKQPRPLGLTSLCLSHISAPNALRDIDRQV